MFIPRTSTADKKALWVAGKQSSNAINLLVESNGLTLPLLYVALNPYWNVVTGRLND